MNKKYFLVIGGLLAALLVVGSGSVVSSKARTARSAGSS